MRKLRFGTRSQGKRGGFRVIFYVLTDELPIGAIALYAKNEKSDLTPDERRGAAAIVTAIKDELRRQKAR